MQKTLGTIVRDIPPVVRQVYEVPFIPEEMAAYDAYWDKTRRVLTLDNRDPFVPKSRWVVQKALQKSVLLSSSWLSFIMLGALFPVKELREEHSILVVGNIMAKSFRDSRGRYLHLAMPKQEMY